MKKQFLAFSSAAAVAALYLAVLAPSFFMTSCSKKEDPAPTNTTPGVTITSVTSASVTLSNQAGSSNQFYLVSTKTYPAATSTFDIAYGNGTGTGNKYFVGGPTDESIKFIYPGVVATNVTEFYNVPSTESSKFDSLVNVKAVAAIFAVSAKTSSATGGLSTRIKSETAWPAGTVFGFTTSAGTQVLAKVTSASTGNTTTAGTFGLQLKY